MSLILNVASVVVAAIVGAIEGHTTDIGFLQGSVLGVVAGVITAVQLFGPVLHSDQPLSKFGDKNMKRVAGGFTQESSEWESHYGIGTIEELYSEHPDVLQPFRTSNKIELLDLLTGEVGRKLARCGHTFHMNCIDEWLLRQETCPICRDHLSHNTTST
ncbi:unnamed protein product [Arabidopsis thaliana]|uniref:RING-type domain-containing protein n=1 Tax=Arabidopsis thaliana TaxID=3702 RepID=Q9LTQ2_ARATH|nr:unnamed protein product [Arabidopsis thaliana]